jgi:protein phosphatase
VPLFVVADGMGGAQAGEFASRTAVKMFSAGLPAGDRPPEDRLAELAHEANVRIYEEAQRDSKRAGMGTTLTAAYVGEEEVSIAHVGDSRAYRLRDGQLERLTEDHSLVEELLRQGRLTEEEAEGHPQRSIITRALGPEPEVEVDRLTARARAGDVYLICSDGLTSMVPESRVLEILDGAPSLAVAGRGLIDAANSAGGRDNVTVVLFSLEEVSGARVAVDETEQQATTVGAGAPRAEQVRAALETPRGAPVAPEAPRPRSARVPRMPAPATGSRRRRMPRPGLGSLVALAVLALVVAGGWVASQTVYFVGTNADGLVTVYRGVPYDLPAGVHLYSTNFISGVNAAQLTSTQQHRLLDHTLRSHDDATDLVRKLELGQLQAR